MSNPAKVLRGQLRQITKEVLPELLNPEMKSALFNALQEEIRLRLTKIENNVKETLEALETRQKDTLGYLVRQVSNPTPSPVSEPVVDATELKSE